MAEITDRESFESWLEGKPIEWAQVLAMRSALRVFPLVGQVLEAKTLKPKDQQQLIFTIFRASSISWVACKYPTDDMVLAALDANVAAKAAALAAGDAAGSADATLAFRAANAAALATHATFTAAKAATITAKTAANAADYTADYAVSLAAGFWSALNRDAEFLENHIDAPEAIAQALAEHALWLNDQGENAAPEWVVGEFDKLAQNLSGFNDNWHVCAEWYQSRLQGRESWGLNAGYAETLMLRIANKDYDWWEQGPSIVNAEIAGWLAELRAEEASDEILPDEPAQGPGPEYGFSTGKLSASGSQPSANEAEDQLSLHNRVKAKAAKLNDLMLTTANQYPELAEAVAEYLDLLNQPIDQIDVDGLWSVGGALFELKEAYADQNHTKTMTVALEPPETAALSGLCRDHGALILGFDRGVELVERADHFARNAHLVLEITEPSKPVLTQLTNNRELVEEETRKLHKPILDALNETGWAASRTSYSGYLTIRNSTLAIAKFLFGAKDQGLIPIASTVVVGAGLAGYPTDQVALFNAIQFLLAHGSQLLAIFKHSPEMHAFVQAAINLIRHEKSLLEDIDQG